MFKRLIKSPRLGTGAVRKESKQLVKGSACHRNRWARTQMAEKRGHRFGDRLADRECSSSCLRATWSGRQALIQEEKKYFHTLLDFKHILSAIESIGST